MSSKRTFKAMRMFLLPLGIGLCLLSTPRTALADAKSDWAAVAAALDTASKDYALDCPQGMCGPATSAIHQTRVGAYAQARSLLMAYKSNWASDANSEAASKALFWIAFTSSRADLFSDALSFYTQCRNSPGAQNVSLSVGGPPQPLKSICAKGVEDQCHLVYSFCQVQTDNLDQISIVTKKPRTLTGHTADVPDAREIADQLEMKVPDDLRNVTPEQQIQLMEHLRQMSPAVNPK